jgi:hypothetical protein
MMESAISREETINDNMHTSARILYPERARIEDAKFGTSSEGAGRWGSSVTPSRVTPEQIKIFKSQVPRPPITQHRKLRASNRVVEVDYLAAFNLD